MTKAEKRARRRLYYLPAIILVGVLSLITAVLWSNHSADRQSDRANDATDQAAAATLDRATACAQVQMLGLRCAVPLPPQDATDPSKASPPLNGRDGSQGPVGPIGITGATGPTGARGQAGLSAYQLAVKAGFRGTLRQWLASLVGPPGPRGQAGQAGETGEAGTNGADGTPGADGSPGQPGADGSPGTPGADGQTCVDRDHDGLWSCSPGPYTGPTESATDDTPLLGTPAPTTTP